MAIDGTTALRLRLIENGYRLVECRGKVPFLAGWQASTPTADAVSIWNPSTNTGLILGPQPDGSWLIAVDIDITDPFRAFALDAAVVEVLGENDLLRIGQPPKRLRLWRLDGELPKKVKIHFAEGHVEFLTTGQQCIGFGIHPDTGNPYTWPQDHSPEDTILEDVPIATPARLQALIDRLCREGGSLAGPARVNGSAHPKTGTQTAIITPIGQFRTDGREAYMTSLIWAALVGEYRDCPIKPAGEALQALFDRVLGDYHAHTESRLAGSPDTLAARLEQEGRGRTLFAAKWTYALAKWDGAIAKAAGVDDPHPGSPRDDASPAPATPTAAPSSFDLAHASARRWKDKEIPEIEFVVADLFPFHAASIIGGDSGAGKSIFMQIMATFIAARRPFLNRLTKGGPAVYITAEDTEEILHVRHTRIMSAFGIGYDDIGDRLILRSMADHDIWLYQNRNPTALAAGLVDELQTIKPVWVSIDSAALVFDDEEILRRPVAGFMQYLNRTSRVLGCGIGLVAHTSRSSKGTTTTMVSGSTGWVAQSRSGVLLEVADDQAGVTVSLIKPNYAKRGLNVDLTWNDEGVLTWDEPSYSGDISPAQANLVLDEIERRFQAGYPRTFCLSINSPRSLLKYLRGKTGGGLKLDAAQRVVSDWVDNGMIEEQEIGRRQVGVRVLKRPGPA